MRRDGLGLNQPSSVVAVPEVHLSLAVILLLVVPCLSLRSSVLYLLKSLHVVDFFSLTALTLFVLHCSHCH